MSEWENSALTAAELIGELSKIDPATVITWTKWDSEYDFTYVYGIGGVAPSGELAYGGTIRSHSGMYEDDDEEVDDDD